MELSEFLKDPEPETVEVPETVEAEAEVDEVELDVQKAVVESLAADKVEQDEQIANLRKDNYRLQSQIAILTAKLEAQTAELAKVGDLLAANADSPDSNKVSLLEREVKLNDRFLGETRDHVLEVLREARDVAEKEGRVRRAQVLESVLLANEPVGNLVKNRENLQNLFTESGNILSGPVLAELNKLGISAKNGENYLLPAEILKRAY